MLQGRLKEQPTSLHSSPLTSDMVTWEPVINHLAYEKRSMILQCKQPAILSWGKYLTYQCHVSSLKSSAMWDHGPRLGDMVSAWKIFLGFPRRWWPPKLEKSSSSRSMSGESSWSHHLHSLHAHCPNLWPNWLQKSQVSSATHIDIYMIHLHV